MNDKSLNFLNDSLAKIDRREFVVGIIGLGYVGLNVAINFLDAKYTVLGIDVDVKKTELLGRGESYINYIRPEKLAKAVKEKRFRATTDYSLVADADAIIIAVPTPLTINRVPDMQYIHGTALAIKEHLRNGQVIVLESTTYPGTTEDILVTTLEEGGLREGTDFYVGYSPEREDPNNTSYQSSAIPKIISALSPVGLSIIERLYSSAIEKVIPVESVRVAEAEKLLENIFRAVNIALVNEMKVALMEMGIDIWQVIEAAKTKPFGYMPFYPGPGLGGHCIPIDPFYFTWKAREYGVSTRFIELAGEVNSRMPEFVVNRAALALNEKGKPIKGSKVLVLGIAYKKDVDDFRESPSYHIMKMLSDRGALLAYNDPYIPVITPSRLFEEFEGLESVEVTGDHDLIILATDHTAYKDIDFEGLDTLIVDTRNQVKGSFANLHKA